MMLLILYSHRSLVNSYDYYILGGKNEFIKICFVTKMYGSMRKCL